MRFGKSAEEAAQEPSRGGGGGEWIKYLKEGDTTFRILQDKDDWVYYWEHFSPQGFSFPCSNEDDCHGCVSDNEKMKKVSRKIAFNALGSWQGQEYVNVYKVGTTVADKLENRIKRFGTVTDRDYTITKYKTSGDRWDFDVEGGPQTPIDVSKYDLMDIEKMLQQAWDDAWGDPNQAAANAQGASSAAGSKEVKGKPRSLAIAPQPQPEEPPFEEPVYQEADLRKMNIEEIRDLVKREVGQEAPDKFTTTDEVVDWLMTISA